MKVCRLLASRDAGHELKLTQLNGVVNTYINCTIVYRDHRVIIFPINNH